MGHLRDRWKEPGRRGTDGRWQVIYQVDGRDKYGGSFDNREVAKRTLVELEASVHRGQWVNPNDRTTVVQEARSYAASRPYGRATEQRVDGFIRNHLEPTPLGSMRITAVRASDVQRWVTDRSTMMAPTTLRALAKRSRGLIY